MYSWKWKISETTSWNIPLGFRCFIVFEDVDSHASRSTHCHVLSRASGQYLLSYIPCNLACSVDLQAPRPFSPSGADAARYCKLWAFNQPCLLCRTKKQQRCSRAMRPSGGNWWGKAIPQLCTAVPWPALWLEWQCGIGCAVCHWQCDLTLGLLVVGQRIPHLCSVGRCTTHPVHAWTWKLGGFGSKCNVCWGSVFFSTYFCYPKRKQRSFAMATILPWVFFQFSNLVQFSFISLVVNLRPFLTGVKEEIEASSAIRQKVQ